MAANTIAGFGFKDASTIIGSAGNYSTLNRRIAYNYSSQIAYGDPVKLLNDGTIALVANGDTTIDGIFAGCNYTDTSALYNYSFRPSWTAPSLASTATVTAKVIVDPMYQFIAQVSGGTAIQSNIGNNIDILTGTSGVPNAAGFSTCLLDGANLGSSITTATLPFRIMSIIQSPGFTFNYDPAGANNLVMVKLNTSDLVTSTGI